MMFGLVMKRSFLQAFILATAQLLAPDSVVTKDVPPYSIVGGAPAKQIRQRFDAETIKQLEALQWWDWSVEKIVENISFIQTGDIGKLKLSIK